MAEDKQRTLSERAEEEVGSLAWGVAGRQKAKPAKPPNTPNPDTMHIRSQTGDDAYMDGRTVHTDPAKMWHSTCQYHQKSDIKAEI